MKEGVDYMIKLANKDLLGLLDRGVDIYRPYAYDENTEEHSITRRSNNINSMYYVGYLRDIIGVVKDDNGGYYLELVVSFSESYINDNYFRTNELEKYPESLLGSKHEELLSYEPEYYDEADYVEDMFDSKLRLPFITFTRNIRSSGSFSLIDIPNYYVSYPLMNIQLSAVEEYTRNFNAFTGGIDFYSDDMRENLGAWVPIGSGYYIRVSDSLMQSNAYLKYIKETSWIGQSRTTFTRRVMDIMKEIGYTKVEITSDDGSVNIYTIRKMTNRGEDFPVLLNTANYNGVYNPVFSGFYHPFLDDTVDTFGISYMSETGDIISDIVNRSVIEHILNNTDMYMNELRLSDKVKLIK